MARKAFTLVELKLDLPKEDGEKDLEVPADWVMPRTAPVMNHGA
jgi:hypothetical protein